MSEYTLTMQSGEVTRNRTYEQKSSSEHTFLHLKPNSPASEAQTISTNLQKLVILKLQGTNLDW